MIVRIVIIAAGIILLILAEKAAPVLDGVIAPVLSAGREHKEKTAVNVKAAAEEEDILDNKTKWRILLIGYALFLAIAIFSLISIFTLNNKINTLYNSIQDMEYRVNTMETGAGDK